ncbi:histamine H1 receptor-like [Gigantopelta aegis]|uniref:histamine H1 receptor-like n=1 Tax=Gigantopelta aegis TaxID=1735272 RepID=UPI001B88C2DC|nr:histamine H1 receptor-like [Gigantopelta aegis]XP_041369967.1 histamine H1 receptor-like [Gigantopelta aegis]XP_041369968.1 histamine H1 receptor-like [Gigantopelta aegis]
MNNTDDMLYILRKHNQQFANLMLPAMGLLGTLMGIGLIGNLLVLYIYQAKLKHNTTRSFVLTLAMVDLISCTVAMPGEIVDMLQNYTFGTSPACKMMRTINSFSAFASGIILFVVAVDRYKKICSPLGHQISTRSANVIILICFVISLLLSLPGVFLYGEKTVLIGDGSVNGSDCSTQDRYHGTSWPIMYNSLQFCVFVIGAVGLSILYFFIGKRIWRHRRFQTKGIRPSAKSSSSGTDSSHNSTEAAGSPTYVYTNNRGAPQFFNDPQDDCSTVTEKHIFLSRNHSRICTCQTTPEEESNSLKWPITDKDIPKLNGYDEKSNSKMKPQCRESSINRFRRISMFGFGREASQNERSACPRCAAHRDQGTIGKRNPSGLSQNSKLSFDRQHSTESGVSRRESNARKTTLMLFVITVVYILSFLPHLVLMATKALDKNSLSGEGGATELVHNIIIRSYFINSVANPIVYGLCCQRFRTELVKLLTCKSCR